MDREQLFQIEEEEAHLAERDEHFCMLADEDEILTLTGEEAATASAWYRATCEAAEIEMTGFTGCPW